MRVLIVLFIALLAVPAQACVHSVNSNSVFAQVCVSSDLCKTIFLAELKEKASLKQSEELRQTFQDFMDYRLPLTELVLDEVTRGENPGCEEFFWSDEEGKETLDSQATHIVARGCVIENVKWDSSLGLFVFTIRRTQSCQ